jgi:O-antigen biosynthesis protein
MAESPVSPQVFKIDITSLDIESCHHEDILPDINIPVHQNPLVSIVIPSYGNLKYTLNCLRSLTNMKNTTSFEIIIVDDCSRDPLTFSVLKEIRNIRVFQMQENSQFSKVCNFGASMSEGDFILLLNNDTYVGDNFLGNLVETFDFFENCGAVGGRLWYDDGTLQESGGMVFRDGSAWNVGKTLEKAEELSLLRYAREVDYCSGACLMVPASIWKECGGLDDGTFKAYCEDSDLCFRISQKGYKVMVQPHSNVVHYEGKTNSTDEADVSSGKYLQVLNSEKFKSRWEKELSKRPVHPSCLDDVYGINKKRNPVYFDRMAPGNVLFITPWAPEWKRCGCSFHWVVMFKELVKRGISVTHISDNGTYMEHTSKALEKWGVRCVSGIQTHDFLQKENHFDVIVINLLDSCKNIDSIRNFAPHAMLVYHVHDILYTAMERNHDKNAPNLKREQIRNMKMVDQVVVISEDERQTLIADSNGELCPENIFTCPVPVNLPTETVSCMERKGAIFLANEFHPPNISSANHFVKNVLPKIHSEKEIVIHGISKDNIQNSDMVTISSERVDDLDRLLEKFRVGFCPLILGGGLKVKVIRNLVNGLPVVGFPISFEGYDKYESFRELKKLGSVCECHSDQDFAEAMDYYMDMSNEDYEELYGKTREKGQHLGEEFNRILHDMFNLWFEKPKKTVFPVNKSNEIVSRHYREILEREPDESGMHTYSWKLENGTLGEKEFVEILRNSDEYKKRC